MHLCPAEGQGDLGQPSSLHRGKKGPHVPETGGADCVQLGSAAPMRRGKVMAGLRVLVLGQRLPAQEARFS